MGVLPRYCTQGTQSKDSRGDNGPLQESDSSIGRLVLEPTASVALGVHHRISSLSKEHQASRLECATGLEPSWRLVEPGRACDSIVGMGPLAGAADYPGDRASGKAPRATFEMASRAPQAIVCPTAPKTWRLPMQATQSLSILEGVEEFAPRAASRPRDGSAMNGVDPGEAPGYKD